jgi:nitrogen fixation NifU-like protein
MLRELYQETILDHNRHPRNRGRVAGQRAEGYNPLCGDQVEVSLHTQGGTIDQIAFEGQGCAISTASASLMTQAVKGKTTEEAEALFRRFQALVTDTSGAEPDWDGLGDLAVFAGVRELPVRIKCATLPWHTLHAALNETPEATTE